MATATADPASLQDLELSIDERAEEAAETAAARERELGGSQEAVQAVYERVKRETKLELEQGELDRSPSQNGSEAAAEAGEEPEQGEAGEEPAGGVDGAEVGAQDAEDGKSAELQQEAGPAVGEMPAAPVADADPPPQEIVVRGPEKLRKYDGKQPGTVVLKLKSATIAVEGGAFKTGQILKFSGSCVVVGDHKDDKLDKETGIASEAKVTFPAAVLDFELEQE